MKENEELKAKNEKLNKRLKLNLPPEPEPEKVKEVEK